MKNKNEVLNHLGRNAYTLNACRQISSFLVGAGLKGISEEFEFIVGGGTWADFYEWWENEVVDNDDDIFYSLLDYLCEQQDKTTNNEEKKQLDSFIVFLLESFSDEVNEE